MWYACVRYLPVAQARMVVTIGEEGVQLAHMPFAAATPCEVVYTFAAPSVSCDVPH